MHVNEFHYINMWVCVGSLVFVFLHAGGIKYINVMRLTYANVKTKCTSACAIHFVLLPAPDHSDDDENGHCNNIPYSINALMHIHTNTHTLAFL